MRGLPALRVPPERAARIGWRDLAAGYAACLLGAPLAALGLGLLPRLLPGPNPFVFPAGPLRGLPAETLLALLASPGLAWAAALVSLVPVLRLRRAGLVGWGPALAAGVALASPVLLVLRPAPGDPVPVPGAAAILLAGALLGLAFWAGVRLRRPEAFRSDLP